MAGDPTKDPKFITAEDIKQENDRRKKSIEELLKKPTEQIRSAIQCTLDSTVGGGLTPQRDKSFTSSNGG